MKRMEWIRRLMRVVEESDIDTLEVSRFGTRVRISKSPAVQVVGTATGGPTASAPTEVPPVSTGSGEVAGSLTAEGRAVAGEVEQSGSADGSVAEITSPMVGTFYRAPAPDAPPYVEVGDRIVEGQTLCILEAMKLMNELESDVAGVVREIAVQNAEPVEYGELLFRIEPDGTG
jgi:acetyl-CoA carboxylase biotin carboxyl carrier protein